MSDDGRYTLETPENVEVDFELAGPGSRFCAMLLDTICLGLVLLFLVLVAMFANFGFWRLFPRSVTQQDPMGNWLNWVNALLILCAFLVLFGYYVLCELLMRGQTPGKRAVKIRVIREDGTPAAAMDIVVRNLVRIVDALPGGYAIGGLVMFMHPMHKRLGDIAAGTIVVKERRLDYRAQPDRRYAMVTEVALTNNVQLTQDERHVLTGFLARRTELLREARARLAERLARPLFQKYGGHFGDAESYIERLVDSRHFENPATAQGEAIKAWISRRPGEGTNGD